jgi:hypothetical protein
MPNLKDFIGPKPEKNDINNLEKIIGSKPCSKCELNSKEYYWDPINFVMTWTCMNGHHNTVKVNS